MTTAPVHMIGQSIVDLVIHSADYRDVQEEAADLFKSTLSQSVNRLFDEVNDGSLNAYFFQRVHIDLGTIDRRDFSKEFEKRLLEQLRRSLHAIRQQKPKETPHPDTGKVTVRSEQDNRFELLTHFLLKGFLPWQSTVRSDQSLEQLFATCISDEPLRIAQFLFSQGASDALVKRIVFQFSEELVYSLIGILAPAEAAFIIAYLGKLKMGQRRRQFVKKSPQNFEKVRLRVTLLYLLDRRDSYFNRKEFVRSTLHSVAQHYNITYEEVLKWFMAVLDEENELRDSKSELATIIREIGEPVPAPVDGGTDPPKPIPSASRSFFNRTIFTEGDSVIVLLRNDNETRRFINVPGQSLNATILEFLSSNSNITCDLSKVVVLYEEGLQVTGIPGENRLSIAQLAGIFRQYIERGYMGSRRLFGRRDRARHLFSTWLGHYPHQFKQLLRVLVAGIEHENDTSRRTAKLQRALFLFFGDKAPGMVRVTSELLALSAHHAIRLRGSYFRQFVILKGLQYTGQTSETAYRKYLMTAVAREFCLSENELEAFARYGRTSWKTLSNSQQVQFGLESNSPFLFRPVAETLRRMAENARAGTKIDAIQLAGPPGQQNKTLQPQWPDKNGCSLNEHLSAIEFYLVFSSLPWWYGHDIVMLRGQLQVLLARKDKQLLALILKHRTNRCFVDSLIQECIISGGDRFVPVLTGLEPALLLQFYGEIDNFLKGVHVPAGNIAFRFFDALLAVIIEGKSFEIRRSDFLSKLFRPLINEKTNSRKRVEKLLVRLMVFGRLQNSAGYVGSDGLNIGRLSQVISPAAISLDYPAHGFADDFFLHLERQESFTRLLASFFHLEYKVPDDTIAILLGGQLGHMILNQYSGRLCEPYNDLQHILSDMKVSQPIHASWIEELSANLGKESSIKLLVKQLAYSKNARRSAWLLRGLLRKKRISFLQYARLSEEEITGSIGILLMHDDTALSFVRDTETVFTAIAKPAGTQSSLFWPLVLDYTLKRSAFNQKTLLYTLLNNFSQAGKVPFYQLVADAISFLQSPAYTGRRQPLLQLLFSMADDKKIAQVLNKKEAPIKLVNAKETAKPVITKKPPAEKRIFAPMLEDGESVYINNAGLVLIYPFIKRLFDILSYTDKNVFKTGEETTRAIQLLQFVAAGFENAGEQYLFFNKILCGADPLLPLETTVELTSGEKEAAESLLSNVINSWPAMKNASIDGLRGSYLLRDGRLKASEESWKLVVENKPYDILLNQLPWGFGTIKLPWMPKPVFVQWR